MGGCILAEKLVLARTAGDNGTAGGTLHQPVLGFLVKPPLGGISSGNVNGSLGTQQPHCAYLVRPQENANSHIHG